MNLLQMSVSGALLVLLVVLVRLAALRAVPKRTFLFLWALVLVRLLIPFPPLLPLPSLVPEGLLSPAAAVTAAPAEPAERPAAIPTAGREPLPRQTAAPVTTAAPDAQTPAQPPVTAAPAATARPQGPVSAAPVLPATEAMARMAGLERAALIVWLVGMAAVAAVFAILYIMSYRRFRRAEPLDGAAAQAWLQAHPTKRKLRLRTLPKLTSPLTYGLFRPVILLPEGLDPGEESAAFALEHEYVHAKRLDACWKLLLAITLAVHWFNPFVWLLWFLANRDLELSCDEEVLRFFGTERRGSYARALLALEEKRSLLPPLHSGFGAGTTKERILAIMKYKKATVLSIALAAVLIAALAACTLGGQKKAGGRALLPEAMQDRLSAVAQMDEEGTLYYVSREDAGFAEVSALLSGLQGKTCDAPENAEGLRFQLSMADGSLHELTLAPGAKSGEAYAALDGSWKLIKENKGDALADLCRRLCPRPAKLKAADSELTPDDRITAETEYPDYDAAHTRVYVTLSNRGEWEYPYASDYPFEFQYLGEWFRLPVRDGFGYQLPMNWVYPQNSAAVRDGLDQVDMELIPGLYRFRVTYSIRRPMATPLYDQVTYAEFRIVEEAERRQFPPLERQSLDPAKAVAEGCCVVTGGETDPPLPVEEFLEKVRLEIPCELRLVYPEEGKVCHVSHLWSPHSGSFFRAETLQNGETKTALFPYLALSPDGREIVLSTFPYPAELYGLSTEPGDVLPLVNAAEAQTEALQGRMENAADGYQWRVLQSVMLSEGEAKLSILHNPREACYQLAVGSAVKASYPENGLHPVHLTDLGNAQVRITLAGPDGEPQRSEVRVLLDGELISTDPASPGADLTVGPVRWGMSEKEVAAALSGTKWTGDITGIGGEDPRITLSAEFCSCPAEISWHFADEGKGLFLNSIEVIFTDAEAFDREAVAEILEESWGARCKYGKARKYSPGVDGPDIAPKEDWYWRTEDFSDEYRWKSGVTARFLTKDGSTALLIDATGRNQAEGRLNALPKTEETQWEVDRLMGFATLIRPSAASWEHFDPAYMHSDDGSEQAAIRVYTPGDRALAEKLFAPYSWLTVDYRGDQFDPADTSDILLDGSLVPTVSVFTPETIFEEGWNAIFTNRTEEDLTLFFPVGLLAERDGAWVRPRFHYDGAYDYISPTLAPGESYTIGDWQFELRHACYDLTPGRYMLTVAASQGGRVLTYGAVVEITGGPASTAGEAFIPFESGGYTLSVPAEYADNLTVETGKMTEHWEILFTVTEKASYEAGQKLSPGNDDGLGWLFSIARISEDELGKLMMWDMSGVDAFAREQSGDYLLLLRPTDVRFLPNGEDDEARMEQWKAMDDWAWASMPERFLTDNASLTPCRHGGSFAENALARVLYYDPAEYGEKEPPTIRFGDGDGIDPLGTPQARETAHKLLWGYRFDSAATAADFPQKGMTVTVTDPLGIELTFREDSDVVAVANVSTDVRYLRMAPDTAETKYHSIGSWACQWYFDAAAATAGESVIYQNGNYTLRLPAEYASRLLVETPAEGDVLFRVSEKASAERWAALAEHNTDTADGWYFSIRRMLLHDLGRAYTGGGSGWGVFARDELGTFYTYDYPVWQTFCPEEGPAPDYEGEAYRQFRTLLGAVYLFDTKQQFIADNHLKPFSFNAMRDFLCFTLYDGTALAETTLRADGKAYPAEWVRNPLSELLWDAELTEIQAPAALPKGTLITLERNGGASLAFWPESDLCLMSSWNSEEHWYRGGGDKAAAALEMAREIAAQEERITAALPPVSGRTADYVSRGVTLSLPEEYVPYLIVDMPESGDTLFRVLQRASWENGQKRHPGEDWGDGWLFSLDRFDEEEFLWEVRAHPTPTEYVAKDGEGGYYILRYPSDVRYVGDDDVIGTNEQGWTEWEAWCRWSRGLAEEHVVSGAGLTSFRKSFCYLETALAAFLTEDYREDFHLHFLDEEGREIDAAAAAGAEAFARELLTERSSYEGDGSVGSGALIRLVFTPPYDLISRVTVCFREGSMFFEEVIDYADRQSTSRTVRMSFSGAGETVGDLMAKWYREAAQNGGRTTDHFNQGMTLAIPEEYADYLHIETPESGEFLFRVFHRYSWENGQKKHPGEDWGEGFLFGVVRLDEDQLLRDLLVYPPQTMAGRDREGNYYLIVESMDVRFVAEDGSGEYASDPHWREYEALVQWTGQAAELFRASNPDSLIPMEKAFCELEIILADALYRQSGGETDIRLVTPESFRFISPEGAVTEGADIPERFDYAQLILLEGSSCWLPEDTPAPEGRPIQLEVSGSSGSSRLLYTFWPGSELVMEDTFYKVNGGHSNRMLRMTLPKDGPNIGYLMAKWYGKAAEDVVHHIAAEVVGYGNDTICIKITDPGDSRLPIGFEMYIGGFYLSEDGEYAPAAELPLGCTVEVEYSGEVVADEFGYCSPTGGPSGSIRVVEP